MKKIIEFAKGVLSSAIVKGFVYLFTEVIPANTLYTAITGVFSWSVIIVIMNFLTSYPPIVYFILGFIVAVAIFLLGYKLRKRWLSRRKKYEFNDFIPKEFEDSLIFFDQRLGYVFSDVNGVKCYKTKKGVDRLMEFLKRPISFDSYSDPIWYFRGNSSLPIYGIRKISRTRCQLELEKNKVYWNLTIRKVIVYSITSGSYYHNFIYVETEGEKPSKYNKEKHEREEYGLLHCFPLDKIISRVEYDNGFTNYLWKKVSTKDAELHMQYTVPYNFIIASKASPFNSNKFYLESELYFNGIMDGTMTFEDLKRFLKTFHKHED